MLQTDEPVTTDINMTSEISKRPAASSVAGEKKSTNLPVTNRGISILRDPHVNKGRCFSTQERQQLGIKGLLPSVISNQTTEAEIVVQNFKRYSSDLDRYVYLMSLLDRNERLFFKVVMENIDITMPIIYTPTVGLACQNYGLICDTPRGLFITIQDAGHIHEVLGNWPISDIKIIVVTDGERILGLGDLGSYGMGIPVGKLLLYTACAGVTPSNCLPITLDVGTNNQKLLEDAFYTGLRQQRVTGKLYDDFIEEFMEAVVKRFGKTTLIQFEDFGNHNAFHLLEKYQNTYCTFNDDIQGTASVVVAGLLSSLRITKKRLSEHTIVFQGAGEAAIGIAQLIVSAMMEEGTASDDAISKIWLVDTKGLVVKDRPTGGVTSTKAVYAKQHAPVNSLEEVIAELKPSIIIGVAAVPGAFTEKIIKDMTLFNKHPVIFALSNPTHKAECTAQDAYAFSDGQCIFASGSPFDPVTIAGKTYNPGQGNNAYLFPSIGLASILCQVEHIPNEVFLKAAHALADQVTDVDLEKGLIYPALKDIRNISIRVTSKLVDYMYKANLAKSYPEPADKEAFVRSQLYCTNTD